MKLAASISYRLPIGLRSLTDHTPYQWPLISSVSVSIALLPDAYQGWGSLVGTYLPGVPGVFALGSADIGLRGDL